MFIPFIVIIPGMISAVLVQEMVDLKNGGSPTGGASATASPTTTRCCS